MTSPITNALIIRRFRDVHGQIYGYERVVYVRMKEKVEIVCRKHGVFWQTPDHHARGTGCPICQQDATGKRQKASAAAVFVKKATQVHDNRYDYSEAVYLGNKEKIKIICHLHGSFPQTPSNHLTGFGCPMCGRERTVASRKLESAEFYRRCEEKHERRYSYPERCYTNPDSVISAVCQIHGVFYVKARNHLWIGQGCRWCFVEKRGIEKRINWDEFYQNAIKIHGRNFEYDKASYSMLTELIRMRCRKHGWFEQRGHKHLSGQGCPTCARQLHRGKWQSSQIPEELKGVACALYYFQLKGEREIFYKIGISNDVERRRRTIQLISNYRVNILEVLPGTLYECMEMEESLHKEYEEYSYTPTTNFPGYTECFSIDVLCLDGLPGPVGRP